MKKRVNIIVSGRVQGVWYRAYTRDKAIELGLKGWVRNNPDGTVEIEAEGEEDKLIELINWCWQGSPASKVTDVKFKEKEYIGEYKDFEIRY